MCNFAIFSREPNDLLRIFFFKFIKFIKNLIMDSHRYNWQFNLKYKCKAIKDYCSIILFKVYQIIMV